MSDVFHAVAKCRWCGGRFRLIYAEFERGQWICEREACAEKQVAHAIVREEIAPGYSPYLFLPLPLQVDMETSPCKRLLVAGAAGACKSYGGRWLAYKLCKATPGLQVLLIRETLTQLFDNHLKYMTTECASLGGAKYVGGNKPRVDVSNGAQITMGYCADRSHLPNITGPEWDVIIIEEGNNIIKEALIELPLRDRGSNTAKRGAGIPQDGRTIILANPGGRGAMTLIDHYITKDVDREEVADYDPSHYGFFGAKLEDNPYLPESYQKTQFMGLSIARYNQLRHGDWTVSAGNFFHNFDVSMHVSALEAPL